MTKETIQKAGDNSCQTQVQNLTINYGITEERARQICFDISQKAIAENTAFASEELTKRLQKLENIIKFLAFKNSTRILKFLQIQHFKYYLKRHN